MGKRKRSSLKRTTARDSNGAVGTARKRKSAEGSTLKNVEVWIVGELGGSRATADVLIRPGGMVLEIAGAKGVDALLPGKLVAGVYNAIEDRPPPGIPPIRARWAKIGRRYVGTWLEDGEDYLFSFVLPG